MQRLDWDHVLCYVKNEVRLRSFPLKTIFNDGQVPWCDSYSARH